MPVFSINYQHAELSAGILGTRVADRSSLGRSRLALLGGFALALQLSACTKGDGFGDGGGGHSEQTTTTTEITSGTDDTVPTSTGTDETSDVPASCDDQIRNQGESDIDCGGAICLPCELEETCMFHGDCATKHCLNGTCALATCSDGVKNQDETGIDCGGSCESSCEDNSGCQGPDDCASGVCEAGVCLPARCDDAVKNGSETAVDCGGDDCPGCPPGGECVDGDDCLSDACIDGLCQEVACTQDMQCSEFDGPCTVGRCILSTHTCVGLPANDGTGCETGKTCVQNEVCQSGACIGGEPVDCSGLDDACSTGVCDSDSGACVTTRKYIYFEDFDTPDSDIESRGWRFSGADWESAPLVDNPAVCGTTGADPRLDHSDGNAKNAVLGTAIGACTSTTPHGFECVRGPEIDGSSWPDDVSLQFWSQIHSPSTNDGFWHQFNVYNVSTGLSDTIWEGDSNSRNDTQWRLASFSLVSYRGQKIRFEFCTARTTFADASAGWVVDDLAVLPQQCVGR